MWEANVVNLFYVQVFPNVFSLAGVAGIFHAKLTEQDYFNPKLDDENTQAEEKCMLSGTNKYTS